MHSTDYLLIAGLLACLVMLGLIATVVWSRQRAAPTEPDAITDEPLETSWHPREAYRSPEEDSREGDEPPDDQPEHF